MAESTLQSGPTRSMKWTLLQDLTCKCCEKCCFSDTWNVLLYIALAISWLIIYTIAILHVMYYYVLLIGDAEYEADDCLWHMTYIIYRIFYDILTQSLLVDPFLPAKFKLYLACTYFCTRGALTSCSCVEKLSPIDLKCWQIELAHQPCPR